MRLIWLLLLSVTVVSADFEWWWLLFFGNDNTPSPTPAPTLEPTQCFATCDDSQSTQQQLDALAAEIDATKAKLKDTTDELHQLQAEFTGTAVASASPLNASGYTCPHKCNKWWEGFIDPVSQYFSVRSLITSGSQSSSFIELTTESKDVCDDIGGLSYPGRRLMDDPYLVACASCSDRNNWLTETEFGIAGTNWWQDSWEIVFPKYDYYRNESTPICPGGPNNPSLVTGMQRCGGTGYWSWNSCTDFTFNNQWSEGQFSPAEGEKAIKATQAAFQTWRIAQLPAALSDHAFSTAGTYCNSGTQVPDAKSCLSIALYLDVPFRKYRPESKEAHHYMDSHEYDGIVLETSNSGELCAAPRAQIVHRDQCQSAALDLGYEFKQAGNYSSFHPWCSLLGSTWGTTQANTVWFNNNGQNVAGTDVQSICLTPSASDAVPGTQGVACGPLLRNAHDCVEAATKYSKVYKQALTDSTRTPGCFFDDNDEMYYNFDLTGSIGSDDTPVCYQDVHTHISKHPGCWQGLDNVIWWNEIDQSRANSETWNGAKSVCTSAQN